MITSNQGCVLVVTVKGSDDFVWKTINPTVIPRVGELVEFIDGDGVVESVRWTRPNSTNPPIVTAECVPVRP